MLDPEDIEQIRRIVAAIVREEFDRAEKLQALEQKRALSAERSRRYRERHAASQESVTHRHATVTQNHANPQESVTHASRNGVFSHAGTYARDNVFSYEKNKEEEKGGVGDKSNNSHERSPEKQDNPKAARHAVKDRQNGNHDSDSLFPKEQIEVSATNSQKTNRGPVLMSNKVLKELQQNPAYAALDLTKEAFKYNEWCDRNHKPQTVRRFVNWINRIT